MGQNKVYVLFSHYGRTTVVLRYEMSRSVFTNSSVPMRKRLLIQQLLTSNATNQFRHGRVSFHPIPCGTALFGHVTSGATYMAYDRASHSRSLPIRQSHGGPRPDSCSMGLAILSALVRDVV